MQQKYDYVILIGRFQPPHLAHVELVKIALDNASNVIILIGSSFQSRTIKNPWLWKERADMILEALPHNMKNRVKIVPIRDFMYNNTLWVEQVQEVVSHNTYEKSKICVIGHAKDDSSFYLKLFPQWDYKEVGNIDDIHATDIRVELFTDLDNFDQNIGPRIPSSIHAYIKAFTLTPQFEQLKREFEFIKRYREAWRHVPYEPIFVTVDVVVIQSGHILLVRRRAEPGRGLFALSGGFVNSNECLLNAAIRELREETKIKVPEPVLRGSIKATFVADDPNRSLRGRTISHVYGIDLGSGKLPKVKGADDADKAVWIPLSTFAKMEDQMFEDHFHVVREIIGRM